MGLDRAEPLLHLIERGLEVFRLHPEDGFSA
jgi:hypothetical protein